MDRILKGQNQGLLLPPYLDDWIAKDSIVRFIDLFVETQRNKLNEMGFKYTKPKQTGRMAYDPAALLKLYIYAYSKGIRSSRKIEEMCRVNIEAIWLMRNLRPDFHTIANFRNNNKQCMKKVFKQFNALCLNTEVMSHSDVSLDGTKFYACNSPANNYTKAEINERLEYFDEQIDKYLQILDKSDDEEDKNDITLTREEIEEKLQNYKERTEYYTSLKEKLDETGESQVSLNDSEARLMKTRQGYGVCFNSQVAVDVDSHLIAGFKVTNSPADYGQMSNTLPEIKEDYEKALGEKIKLNAIADRGYQSPDDMKKSLMQTIVPNVIPRHGESNIEVKIEYEEGGEKKVTTEQIDSLDPKDISDCLHAGVVPTVYKNILTVKGTCEEKVVEYEDTDEAVLNMTEEEIEKKAKEGFFVRDPKGEVVTCPEGNKLYLSSTDKNGNIKYCNKRACKNCKNKCTKRAFYTASFTKDILIRPSKSNKNKEKKVKAGLKKNERVVKYIIYDFKLDTEKLKRRMATSEHPFGTIKRWFNSGYFLCKGMLAAEAENSLSFLAYNIKRVINMGKISVLENKLRTNCI